MARKSKAQPTGLYYAREARGMSRSELVRLSGVSKQQLSRLENGQIRLRLDHLKPFANVLGYTPEQILLWGRLPLAAISDGVSDKQGRAAALKHKGTPPLSDGVREFDSRARSGRGRAGSRFKDDYWVFPENFVREQLQASRAIND
jgi:transcriptional regulator with XRE-family HTH domain